MQLNPIAPNQIELRVGNKTVFFSYKTPVVVVFDNGSVYRTNKKWSVTTSKHINKYLEGRKAELVEQAQIEKMAK